MLKIGWAFRDVSTNEPVTIVGQAYERVSTGVMDPTTITVLFLEDGKDEIIFVSGDFTSFTPSLYQEVKKAVEQRLPGLDGRKIIMNATHTHTAPRYHDETGYDKAPRDRLNLYPPAEYRAFLVSSIADAVEEAYAKRGEGSIAYGFGETAVTRQRRVVYDKDQGATNTASDTFAVNGFGKMYGKTNHEDFSGFEGCIDTHVFLLFTFDEAENLTGAVVNLPCPSQCTENETFTSADFWNEIRVMIREKYGNIYILPQCAAGGDLSPHVLIGKVNQARKARLKYGNMEKAEKFLSPHEYYNRLMIAERVAKAFDEGYQWASKEKFKEAPIVHVTKKLELPPWLITKKEYETCKKSLEELRKVPFVTTDDPLADFTENTTLSSNLFRYEDVIQRYERGGAPEIAEIHVVKLGDIAFTTCHFELFLNYQLQIQARSPFEQTFMVQLAASDGSTRNCYLPTEKAVANKGYSAIMYSCAVHPDGGKILVEEILKTLNEIK